MKGKILGNCAVISADSKILKDGFGLRMEDKIYLHPIEAVYLQLNMDYFFAELEELFKWAKSCVENFETMYFVFEDLRNKGIKVRINGKFLVGKKVYMPLYEKEKIKLSELIEFCKKFPNFTIAVVDEESEVTYYSLSIYEPLGEQKEILKPFDGILVGNTVFVKDKEIFNLHFYGSERKKFVTLSLVEAAYLAKKGVLKMNNFEVEDEIKRKLEVYEDLKKRGLIVKTGFKFGSDFRAYEKVSSVLDLPHSKYLITIADDKEFKLNEIVRAVRLAQNVRKTMLFVVGSFYLKVERVKL
ncbi:MAG: tRNA-intron lyase [Archaeoglobaceae archaeon]|nr:tRNA-intron lyase [Archaeoglobaceae archaeon]MCX8151620.1 tRNA-intron lyase [Archaeoglobaceae archaeon]MDW8013102.1 tRNA-intron lyase [Archaeoglobaceae archaeon]